MRTLPVFLLVLILIFAGCASQEPVETEMEESAPAETEAEVVETPVVVEEPSVLDEAGIAGFELFDGSTVADMATISLATGGGSAGRLIPVSTDDSVTLYVTRDGSVPTSSNNWGGPVDPANPPVISRQLEGSGVYKVVAELDGDYSHVFTIYVSWSHEESPSLGAPIFMVDGREVSGSVEIPVSDGSDAQRRLYISSNYTAATLFITRDGTDPTPGSFWKSQIADGTYVFSPEPTAAAYRAIAVWQGVQSDVAALDVTWIE